MECIEQLQWIRQLRLQLYARQQQLERLQQRLRLLAGELFQQWLLAGEQLLQRLVLIQVDPYDDLSGKESKECETGHASPGRECSVSFFFQTTSVPQCSTCPIPSVAHSAQSSC